MPISAAPRGARASTPRRSILECRKNQFGCPEYALRSLRLACLALMILMVSVSFFSLRLVYTTSRTLPTTDSPSRLRRSSYSECRMSIQSSPSGSAKIVAASSNETPCFSWLRIALAVSHENTVYVYTLISQARQPAEPGHITSSALHGLFRRLDFLARTACEFQDESPRIALGQLPAQAAERLLLSLLEDAHLRAHQHRVQWKRFRDQFLSLGRQVNLRHPLVSFERLAYNQSPPRQLGNQEVRVALSPEKHCAQLGLAHRTAAQ